MKLHIAICDDENTDTAYLSRMVNDWSQSVDHPVRVHLFENAETLLFSYEGSTDFDILLLDIQMRGMDGVTLAKRIRETDSRVQIIFITGYPDYMAEGYDVSALHYLMKPVRPEKLREVLNKAVDRLTESPRSIVLPLREGNIRIPEDEIEYAEVFSHEMAVYTKNQKYGVRISTGDMEKLLGEGFLRCHRSYIVNLRHVRKITRTALFLDNGVALPLSRSQYDAVNQAFIQYN